MGMNQVRLARVQVLPDPLEKDMVYFVQISADLCQIVVTDNAASPTAYNAAGGAAAAAAIAAAEAAAASEEAAGTAADVASSKAIDATDEADRARTKLIVRKLLRGAYPYLQSPQTPCSSITRQGRRGRPRRFRRCGGCSRSRPLTILHMLTPASTAARATAQIKLRQCRRSSTDCRPRAATS